MSEKSVLSLEVNGAEIDAGNMWPMDGGPRSSLDWLTSHLAEYDLKMVSGNIVLGGTALGMHLVQSGDHIVVKIGGKTALQCQNQRSPNLSNGILPLGQILSQACSHWHETSPVPCIKCLV